MPVSDPDYGDFDEIPAYPCDVATARVLHDVTSAVSDADLKDMQLRDPDLRELVGALNDAEGCEPGLLRRAKNFLLKNGVLYKRNANSRGELHLLCVPEELKKEMMLAIHNGPLGGHLGFTKCYDKLCRKYYWLNMKKQVETYIKQCLDCQTRNKKRMPNKGLLQPLSIGAPFERVGIDLWGPLTCSQNGNKMVIVASDYATRFVEAKAVKDGSATTVADFLFECIICRHGAFKELLSDNALVFRGEVMRELVMLVGGEQHFTTAYHPQCNGLVERFNSTLGNMLSYYTDSRQLHWDEALPSILFAYNTSIQASTQYSPFELVYGRMPILPIDQALCPNITTEYVLGRKTDIETAREIARKNIQAVQDKMKDRYDKVHKKEDFKVGDKIMLFSPIKKKGLSPKLTHKNYGPYTISRKISDLNYEIMVPKGKKREMSKQIVHINRMTLFHAPEPESSDDENNVVTSKVTSHTLTHQALPTTADSESAAKFELYPIEGCEQFSYKQLLWLILALDSCGLMELLKHELLNPFYTSMIKTRLSLIQSDQRKEEARAITQLENLIAKRQNQGLLC
ncbi:hypothetical protein B566_EDAN017623 [Ephemera danica]|nr:hypothetical protein B566_EDAN017623 [Ephemera danica]